MKPWLKAIAERVNTTGDPPDTLADAVDLLAAIGAPYQAGTVGDVIACLIERCEQLEAELDRLRQLENALLWKRNRCVHGAMRLEKAIEEAEKARK